MAAHLVGVYDGLREISPPFCTVAKPLSSLPTSLAGLAGGRVSQAAGREDKMGNYNLVPESPEYVSVGNYVTGEGYSPVGNYSVSEGYATVGEDPAAVAPKSGDFVPETTVIREESSGWKITPLVGVLAAALAWTAWKAHKGGCKVLPAFISKPVSGMFGNFGHSGRTTMGRIGRRRGRGHYRASTGRFHFHG